MTVIIRDGSVRIIASWKDFEGTPVTPDSQTLVIRNPDGTTNTTITSPTVDTVGMYYYDFDTSTVDQLGTYTFTWKADGSGFDDKVDGSFTVRLGSGES